MNTFTDKIKKKNHCLVYNSSYLSYQSNMNNISRHYSCVNIVNTPITVNVQYQQRQKMVWHVLAGIHEMNIVRM